MNPNHFLLQMMRGVILFVLNRAEFIVNDEMLSTLSYNGLIKFGIQ